MPIVTTKQKHPRALEKIVKRYRQNKDVLEVGFPKELADSIRYPSVRDTDNPGSFKKNETPPRVTDVAFINEFGSQSLNIPARPFMKKSSRPTEKLFKKETVKLMRQLNGKSASANLQTKFLKLMGPKVTSIFRKTITDLREPPNAPATIELKGSDNPLIDTGLMRQTLTHLVTRKKKSTGVVV